MARKISLRTRLFGWTLIFSIIPVILATTLGYYYGRKYLLKEIQNHINTLLKLEIIKIDAFVSTKKIYLNEFIHKDLIPIMEKDTNFLNLESVVNSILSSKAQTEAKGSIFLITDMAGKIKYFSEKLDKLPPSDFPIINGTRYIKFKIPFTVKSSRYQLILLMPLHVLIDHLGIEELKKIGYQVEIFDFKGDLIFSSQPFTSPVPVSCYYQTARKNSWMESRKFISRCHIYEPLKMVITISRDKKSAFSAITKLRNAAFVFIIAIIFFTIVITSLFSNEITLPLKEMAEKAKIIGEGNFSERVPILRYDEIGKFAMEFNRMADKLEKLYNTLEEKVEERTQDLQRALSETRAISERLELILNNISAGVITLKENGEIIEINRAAKKIFPLKKGDNLTTFARESCGVNLFDDIDNEGRITCEREGRELIIDYKLSKAMEEDNEIIYVFTFEEITEKILFEQKLIQSEKLATVGILAAGLAHEIGTPLNIIMGRAEVLKESLEDHPEAQKSLNTIIEQIDRITEIIRQLLDFVKPREPALKETDIIKVAQKILDLLDIRIKKKKITFEKEFDPDLPRVKIDPHQWEQVFLNLFMNAMDAVKENGTIRFAIRKEEDRLVITISDNGTGIPPENLNKIFDPFFTTKKPGQGTGLGLTVTNNIVKQHGGWIKVSSRPGMGTTFSIYLPIKEDQ